MTRPFPWFPRTALDKMAYYIAHGAAYAVPREEGRERFLDFYDGNGNLMGTVNDSHVCPPDCPPPGGGG